MVTWHVDRETKNQEAVLSFQMLIDWEGRGKTCEVVCFYGRIQRTHVTQERTVLILSCGE